MNKQMLIERAKMIKAINLSGNDTLKKIVPMLETIPMKRIEQKMQDLYWSSILTYKNDFDAWYQEIKELRKQNIKDERGGIRFLFLNIT